MDRRTSGSESRSRESASREKKARQSWSPTDFLQPVAGGNGRVSVFPRMKEKKRVKLSKAVFFSRLSALLDPIEISKYRRTHPLPRTFPRSPCSTPSPFPTLLLARIVSPMRVNAKILPRARIVKSESHGDDYVWKSPTQGCNLFTDRNICNGEGPKAKGESRYTAIEGKRSRTEEERAFKKHIFHLWKRLNIHYARD